MSIQQPQKFDVDELAPHASQVMERLKSGPWPSHVAELEKTKYPLQAYAAGLAAGKTAWAAGSAKIRYVYTGFIARRTRDGKYAELHFRVWQPSGQIYTTDFLRKMLDFADNYGLGLIDIAGQQGTMIVSVDPAKADEAVDVLRSIGTDIGATGDTIRELATCVGPALCEFALYDTLEARDKFLTHPKIYEWMPNQLFPFKFKAKFSGCPFDCTRAIHRADFGFIGVWEGAPEVDQELLRKKVEVGEVDPEKLAADCPSGAITWDKEKKELKIDGTRCRKSMHCIRTAFPAVKPGKNKKIAVVVGGGSKGRFGPKLGWLIGYLSPDQVKDAIDLVFKVIGPWENEAQPKYRLGDYILHVGLDKFIEKAGIKLEGMPTSTAKNPDEVPYAVLPKEVRERFLQFAEQLKGRV